MTVEGIDVSNHQKIVSWPSVAAAGMKFAFCKSTEGTFFRDPYFPGNWAGIKAAGLYRGAYHFARPSSSTPDHEAQYFLEYVSDLQVGDMLVLDIEDEDYHGGGPYENAGKWALGFVEYVEAAVGFKPLVYWAKWYLPDQIASVPQLGDYGLWLAEYRQTPPIAPSPWEFWAFWQYTSTGRVPGVNGDCDINYFNGSLDRIPLYGKPEPSSPPAFEELKRMRDETLPMARAQIDETQKIVEGLIGPA